MTPDFSQSDQVLNHLDGLITGVPDSFIRSRYVGFVAVTAVTIFEINIRNKLIDFCARKHKVFGVFSESLFEKTNARVRIEFLKSDYLKRFGENYLRRFTRKLEALELAQLRAGHGSVKGSYNNLVKWRHDFVHDGILPAYAGYEEARAAYDNGKLVINVFFEALTR